MDFNFSMALDENDTMIWYGSILTPYMSLPVCLFIGLPLNFLSVLTIMNGSLKKLTIFRYLAAVSFADFFVVFGYVLKGLSQIFINVFSNEIRNTLRCRLFSFFLNGFSQASALSLIGVTFDRYLSISFPTRVKTISTIKTSNIIISSIFFYSIGSSLFLIFVQDRNIRISLKIIECFPTTNGGLFFYRYLLKFSSCIYVLLPTICFSILNILIIKNLRNHSKIKLNVIEKSNDERLRIPMKRLTIILFLVTITFLLFTIPGALFNIYLRCTFDSPFKITSLELFLREFFFFFNSVNHMINFLFYYICGKVFRKEMSKLFYCCIRRTNYDKNFTVELLHRK